MTERHLNDLHACPLAKEDIIALLDHAKFAKNLLSPAPEYFEGNDKMNYDLIHAGYGLQGEVLELSLCKSFKNAVEEQGDLLYYLSIFCDRFTVTERELMIIKKDDHVYQTIRNIPEWYPGGVHLVSAAVADLCDLIKKRCIYKNTNIARHEIIDAIYLVLHTIKYMNVVSIDMSIELINSLKDNEVTADILRDLRARTFEGDSDFEDIEVNSDKLRSISFLVYKNQEKLRKRYPDATFTVKDSIERKDTACT